MKLMQHIVIVGLPGVGKTSIGKLLSSKLQNSCIDIDEQIESRQKKSISTLIKKSEPNFRQIEKNIFINIINEKKPRIISVGGGLVMDADNRKAIKDKSLCIYLICSLEEIAKRLDTSERPLLYNTNKNLSLKKLFDLRSRFYEEVANIKVDISNLDLNASLKKVYKGIKCVK